MTRYFLTQLSVEGFRGINNQGNPLVLKFRPDSVNSIFAANGAGKSSIFEALQFAFGGAIPRLEDMQSSERPDDYIPNLFHPDQRSTIELHLCPDDGSTEVHIAVVREPSGNRVVTSPTGHPEPQRLLREMNRDFAMLDYGKFARFIEDTALVRGRSFSSLLGLSEYGDFRRALKAVDNTQTFRSDFGSADLQAAAARAQADQSSALRRFNTQLVRVTAESPVHEPGLDTAAAAIVTSLRGVPLLAPLITTSALQQVDFQLLRAEILREEAGDTRARLLALQQTAVAFEADTDTASARPEQFARLRTAWTEHSELAASVQRANVHALLRAAETYLKSDEEWDLGLCPLCGSEVTTPIDQHVQELLSQYSLLERSAEQIRDLALRNGLMQRLEHLEGLLAPLAEGDVTMSALLRERVQRLDLDEDFFGQLELALERLEQDRGARADQIRQEVQQLETQLPPSLVELTSQVTAAAAAAEALEDHRLASAAQAGAAQRLDLVGRWKSFVRRAGELFSDAEAELTRRTLEDLRQEYQAMFRSVMSTDDIVPALVRSDADEHLQVQLTDFHGSHDIAARAVLSESYRNALAISVFLSAAARRGQTPRFVVLDDVTSSFDSGHQFNLMEYVRTELQYRSGDSGLQFIVLSHDVTLEKYFDRLNEEEGWSHQKLHGWPPMTPVTSQSQDASRLRTEAQRFLRAGQVQEGAGLIRQYLEFTLLQVIRKVQIPVPIDLAVSDHARMVGACLQAITGAVTLHRRAGDLVLDEAQVNALTGRHAPAIIANWISHYSSGGSAAFSPPLLLGVLENIDQFAECFKFQPDPTRPQRRYYKSLSTRA